MIFTICIITFLYFAYLFLRLSRRNYEHLIEKFPGPHAYPLIGNVHEFFITKQEVLKRLRAGSLIYKSPARLWVFGKPIIFIFDPQNIQFVNNKVINKGYIHGFLKYFMGEGLISVDNKEIWKKQRRLLSPAFSPRAITNYLNHFEKMHEELVKEFNKLASLKKEVNIWKTIFEFEYQKVGITLMDYKIDLKTEVGRSLFDAYFEALKKAHKIVTRRMLQPWSYVPRINKLINYLSSTTDRTLFPISQFIQQIMYNQCSGTEVKRNINDDNGVNLIHILLSDEAQIHYGTDKAIQNEILTFLEAGTTTSSTTICFTLLMLAMHQSSQNLIREEINRVFDKDEPLTTEKLDELTHLEKCIKETIRMFPPAPFMTRTSETELKLEDGRIIPAGTSMLLNILLMQRSPRIFSSPDSWNPFRFDDEIPKLNPSSFIPFGIGPRKCIGYKYAMLSMKSEIITILRKFWLTTSLKMEDITLDFNVVLMNKTGHKIQVHKIQEN